MKKNLPIVCCILLSLAASFSVKAQSFAEIQARHQSALLLEVMEYLRHHPDAPDSKEALDYVQWNEGGTPIERYEFARDFWSILINSAPLDVAMERMEAAESIMSRSAAQDPSLSRSMEAFQKNQVLPWLITLLKDTDSVLALDLEKQISLHNTLIEVCSSLGRTCPLRTEYRTRYIPAFQKKAEEMLENPLANVSNVDLSDTVHHIMGMTEFAGGERLSRRLLMQWNSRIALAIARHLLRDADGEVPPEATSLFEQLYYLIDGDEADAEALVFKALEQEGASEKQAPVLSRAVRSAYEKLENQVMFDGGGFGLGGWPQPSALDDENAPSFFTWLAASPGGELLPLSELKNKPMVIFALAPDANVDADLRWAAGLQRKYNAGNLQVVALIPAVSEEELDAFRTKHSIECLVGPLPDIKPAANSEPLSDEEEKETVGDAPSNPEPNAPQPQGIWLVLPEDGEFYQGLKRDALEILLDVRL